MADSTASIAFSVYFNGKLVDEVSFDRPIINLGKLSTSNLRLDDTNASRKHAVIERRESGDWRITDLGSTNGTRVNGDKSVQAQLKDGDRITIGSTTMVVHLSQQALTDTTVIPRVERKTVAIPEQEIEGLGADSYFKAGDDRAAKSGRPMVLEVALLWGQTVMNMKHFDSPRDIVFGEDPGCDFSLPSEVLGSQAKFSIIRAVGGDHAINLTNPAIEGDVLVDGDVIGLSELAGRGMAKSGSYALPRGARARLKAGDFTILVSHVPKAVAPARVDWGGLDYALPILIALSAIIHLVTLWVFDQQPEDRLRSYRDDRDRAAEVLDIARAAEQQQKQDEEEEKKDEEQEDEEKEEKDKEDAEVEGDEALVEDEAEKKSNEELVPDEPKPKKRETLLDRLARKREKELKREVALMSPEDRKKRAKEFVEQTGAASALRNIDTALAISPNTQTNSRFRQLTTNSADGAAVDYAGAMDPFGGAFQEDSGGVLVSGGGGPPGGDPGGGTNGGSIAGLDRKSLKDRDTGKKTDLTGRKASRVFAGTAQVSGRLDRKTVQSYIRRKLSGVRACYQDALQRNANARGKVNLQFKILPNGYTSGVRVVGSSINDSTLIHCITKRMQRWKFPQPKDGGVVNVSYPLVLKSSG